MSRITAAAAAALLVLAGCSQQDTTANDAAPVEAVPPVKAGCQTADGRIEVSYQPATSVLMYSYAPTNGTGFNGTILQRTPHRFIPALGYVSRVDIPTYDERNAANDAQKSLLSRSQSEMARILLNPGHRLTDVFGVPSVGTFCRDVPEIDTQIGAVMAAVPGAAPAPAPSPTGTIRRY